MATYLDIESFERLYGKKGCSAGDIARLRARIYGRELLIPLSIHHLETLLLDPRARPELRVAKTKLVLSLGNYRRMTRSCAMLIFDELRASLTQADSPRRWLDAPAQNIVSEGLSELIETDGEELTDELIELLQDARAQREALLQEVAAIASSVAAQSDSACSQSEYAARFRALALDRLCRGAGLEPPRPLAPDSIEAKCVDSFIQLAAALNYTHETAGLDALPHAVAAVASAEDFVTGSEALQRAAASLDLPIKISNLSVFLTQLG